VNVLNSTLNKKTDSERWKRAE